MTKDDILALDAGRPLDRLIAERVFGCRVVDENKPPPPDGQPRSPWQGYWLMCGCAARAHMSHDQFGGTILARYSTDLNDAWLVGEQEHLFFAYLLSRAPDGTYCFFRDDGADVMDMIMHARTVPLLIARTALYVRDVVRRPR